MKQFNSAMQRNGKHQQANGWMPTQMIRTFGSVFCRLAPPPSIFMFVCFETANKQKQLVFLPGE